MVDGGWLMLESGWGEEEEEEDGYSDDDDGGGVLMIIRNSYSPVLCSRNNEQREFTKQNFKHFFKY